MMVQIKKKNPYWIIKNAKELKRYSQKDTFKLLHYTPPYQEQENLLTSVFIQYHLVNAGLAIHQKCYYHSRINDSFTDLIMVRRQRPQNVIHFAVFCFRNRIMYYSNFMAKYAVLLLTQKN
jgi:hypothetical protein